jgi:hypothetical protein
MNITRIVIAGVALAGASQAWPGPPRNLPEAPPATVQTPATNDPAVMDGLSSDRVAAQARHLFEELDSDRSGELMPRDVPPDLALHGQFLAFDLDGDGRIGLTEFEAYFASTHYRQQGDRWFPRIAADADEAAADATAALDEDID